MYVKRLVVSLCLIVALVLMPSTGCGKSVQYEAIELVPEGVQMVGEIKVSEILRNWELYTEVEEDEEAAVWSDEGKENFLHETGIDLNDVSKAVFFANGSTTEAIGYSGFIIEGNFADKDLFEEIEKETGLKFTEEKYGDYTLYIGEESYCWVCISNTIIILGTDQAVKDSIDVVEGTLSPVGGTIIDTYNNLGDVMLRLAMIIPQETREALADQPESDMMPVGLEAFEDMQALGLAADLGTQALTIKLNLDFSSPKLAAQAGESLQTMMDFITMMSTDEESAEMLKSIYITVGGSTVYLEYGMSLAELADMASSFEEGMGIPMIPEGTSDMEIPEGFELPDILEGLD